MKQRFCFTFARFAKRITSKYNGHKEHGTTLGELGSPRELIVWTVIDSMKQSELPSMQFPRVLP